MKNDRVVIRSAGEIDLSVGSVTAAAGGLPSGELRTQVTAALRESERGFTEYRAAAFEAAAAVMGYRLRDPDAIGWSRLAELLSATFAGLTIQAIACRTADRIRTLVARGDAHARARWR